MRNLRLFIVAGLLAMMSGATHAEVNTDAKSAPYGIYKIDPEHTSITFRINHLGLSHYTGRFDKMEGVLIFNNNAPEQSNLNVTVYPNSIDVNNPKLEEDLRGGQWFNVIQYPRATFHTTRIDRTSATTGKVIGDLTLLGITRRLTFDVTFVGTGTTAFNKNQVLGFSAVTTLDRSDFGMSNLLPMLGNEVVLEIETEFDKDD